MLKTIPIALFMITFINLIDCWSYNPLCFVKECCNNDYIKNSVDELRYTIKSRVYGQHLVHSAIDAIWAHLNYEPTKALTLSFHGWAGGGKNYVSTFIAESLYKYGFTSKFVHNFIGRVHFPEQGEANKYQSELYDWIKTNISECPRQLFIFDEVHLMPPTVLNAIKPLIDYRPIVDKVDPRKAIFIFLSNTGATVINERYHELWSAGIQRENMKLSDFEGLISKGAFNEEGGFHLSDTIKANLIDHYIPFLPMEQKHIKECIIDQFKLRGVSLPKPEHITEVMDFIEWGPKETKLFSKTGCKRISSKVSILVAKHYPGRKTEL